MERPPLSRLGSLAIVTLLALLLTPLAGADLAGGQSTSTQSEPAIIRTIDSAGDVGRFTSVALDTNGLARISYVDVTHRSLKLSLCGDATCSSTNIRTLDTGYVGEETSIAIDQNGRGVITYLHTDPEDDLRVAYCNDAACPGAVTYTADISGRVAYYNSVAIDNDGRWLIAYYDISSGDPAVDPDGDLKVVRCEGDDCTSAIPHPLDSAGDTGRLPSVAIGSDGRGLISYYDFTKSALKVAHCNDAACSSATISVIDDTADVGEFSSLAVGPDGKGLISYYDRSNGDLKVAHCDDAECSSATNKYTLDYEGDVGRYSSLAIGADGRGIISYLDYTIDEEALKDEDLKLAYCLDSLCSSAATFTIDSTGRVGYYTSIAVNAANGTGMISYYDSTNGNLKVAYLPSGFNPPTTTVTPTSASSAVPTSTVVGSPTRSSHTPTPTGSAAATPTRTSDDPKVYLPLLIRN